MTKPLKDILAGVKKSTVEPLKLGDKPGVDYSPKPGDERKFVSKHSIEKHEDRVGNGPEVYNGSNTKYSMKNSKMKNFGHDKDKDESVYEEKKMCNCTMEGTMCEVHGMKECPGYNVNEVLTKKTSAGEIISDFIHSKDKKFKGKSPNMRKNMALGAYYGMHPEKSNKNIKEDLAMPLLGATDIAKNKTDDIQDEIDMVRTELKAIANKAMHMLMVMPKDVHIEPWVQAKIAQAKGMIGNVHDYMVYGDHHKPEEDEQMDTPMTFPGMNVDNALGMNV
jgi:hypothetical protein